MDRKTARRYLRAGEAPDETRPDRAWRTRPDPLSAIWPEAERWLAESPEVEGKALFEHLLSKCPEQVDGRALRTFQRRMAEWL